MDTRDGATIEELARALPEIDWERPTRPQPQGLFVRRRRVGL